MPGEQKALLDSLKSAVRKRTNLRSLFTREDKRVSFIIESRDEGGVQLLKVIQKKLVESKEQLHRLDEAIQDLHVQLDHSDLADQDFEECDILYDNHGLIMNTFADYLSSVSTVSSSSSGKHSKHSSVKLQKMNLPVFSGDRRKWTSFWDVFQSEKHGCQDISNVTKFNYLKGQLSEGVKRRVEGILASDDNYGLLVQTLLDNYGNKAAIKNAHCTALVFATKPQYNGVSLRSFYDGINADVRSLATHGLQVAAFGEFYVPILLEKLPAELLAEVLKLYPDDNPSLEQLLTCIHTEVKKLEQVAFYLALPLLSGEDDEHSAIKYYRTSRQIMSDANMNLLQWFTNSNKLQELIDIEGSGSSHPTSVLLGMVWDIREDTILFPTKSLIIPQELNLSCLESRFLIIRPNWFHITSGCFGEEIYFNSVDVSHYMGRRAIRGEFNYILSEVELASTLPFVRYLQLDPSQTVQLHVFCDACPSTAVGCVAYMVQADTVVLIGSKYKVASSKNTYTVPRWELISMLNGARFATLLIEIRKLTDVNSWSPVSSEDNPADILSRGCSSSHLKKSVLWKFGPTWLTDTDLWPQWSPTDSTSCTEMDTLSTVDNGSHETGNLSQLVDLERFSSYTSLLRTVAYVLKFVKLLKGQERSNQHLLVGSHCLHTREIHDAEVQLLQKHQKEHFPTEISYLRKATTKPKPQLINQLNLRLNDDELLVAPGRLEHAMLNNRARFPVLVAKDCLLTKLIVVSFHYQQLHAGINCTINALSRNFWLPSARSTVSKILRKCVICIRQIGKLFALPLSPALPEFRLN